METYIPTILSLVNKGLHREQYDMTTACRQGFPLTPNNTYEVKPGYIGHSREPENVTFMSSCPLYRGLNYMNYSLMGEMRLSFIVICYRGSL
jgi:hypothetical protein